MAFKPLSNQPVEEEPVAVAAPEASAPPVTPEPAAKTSFKPASPFPVDLTSDSLAEDPSFEPLAAARERERVIRSEFDRSITERGVEGPAYDAALKELDTQLGADPVYNLFTQAHKKRVAKLAESKDYKPDLHYAEVGTDFSPRDAKVTVGGREMDENSFRAAQRDTAAEVYAYRARKFGNPHAYQAKTDWGKVGHGLKEQAKEVFGLAGATRGMGYIADDAAYMGRGALAGLGGDTSTIAKGDLAAREMQSGLFSGALNVINAGYGLRDWWQGDDVKNLTDAQLRERFEDEVKRKVQLPAQLTPENIEPVGGGLPYKAVLAEAGGAKEAPKADLEFLRFGAPTDEKGNPIPDTRTDAEKRAGDIATRLEFSAYGKLLHLPGYSHVVRALSGSAAKLGGAGAELAGNWAGKLIDSKFGHAATAAGTAYEALRHGAGAAVATFAGTRLAKAAARLTAAAGGAVKQIGSEILAGKPLAGGSRAGRAALEGAKGFYEGAVGATPFVLGADTPEDGISLALGLALQSGAGKGAHEAWTGNARNEGTGQQLARLGANLDTGTGFDDIHAAATAAMKPEERDTVNAVRGLMSRFKDAQGNPMQMHAVDQQTFEKALRETYPGASDADIADAARARGFVNTGNQVFLNAGSKSDAGATAKHEGGHLAQRALAALDAQTRESAKAAIAEALYDEHGQPAPEFMDFVDAYNKKAPKAGRLDTGTPEGLLRAEDEFIAEHFRNLTSRRPGLEGIGALASGDSLRNRMAEKFDLWAKTNGIRPPDKMGELGWTELPEFSRRFNGLLRDAFKGAHEKGEPEPAATAVARKNAARMAEIDNMAPGELTPDIINEYDALRKENAEIGRKVAQIGPKSGPAAPSVATSPASPKPPTTPTAAASGAPDAAMRNDVILALGAMGIKGKEAKDLAAAAQGADASAMLADALARRNAGRTPPARPPAAPSSSPARVVPPVATPAAPVAPPPSPSTVPVAAAPRVSVAAPETGPGGRRILTGRIEPETRSGPALANPPAEPPTEPPKAPALAALPKAPEGLGKPRGLNGEGEALIDSIDKGGAAPAFISKNLERIARDNGVEITGSMRPDDVIAALRAKRAPSHETKTQETGKLDRTADDDAAEALIAEAPDKTQAALDLVTQAAGGDVALLQKRTDPLTGKVSYSGRLDFSKPEHRTLIRSLGLTEPDIAKLQTAQGAGGDVRYVDYWSASKEDAADITGKQRKRELLADKDKKSRDLLQKNKAIIFTGVTVWPSGKAVQKGISVDKFIANAGKLVRAAIDNALPVDYGKNLKARERDGKWEAVEVRDGKETVVAEGKTQNEALAKGAINDPALVADLQGYIANHKANVRGDGSGVVTGKEMTPGYEPYRIPRNRFDLLNAAFNVDISQKPAEHAGKLSADAARRAAGEKVRKRPALQPQTELKAEEARRVALENEWQVDDATGDTNPFRAMLNREGKLVYQNEAGETRKGTGEVLEGVFENLSPDMIDAVRTSPAGDRSIVREVGYTGEPGEPFKKGLPDWGNVEAGFMPGENSKEAKREVITDTPQFKKWFGASHVVDESGKPVVVYHGTRKGGFNEFKPGKGKRDESLSFGVHFWKDKALADRYASDADVARKGKSPQVYEAFLAIKNPLDAERIVREGEPEFELAKKIAGRNFFSIKDENGIPGVYLKNQIDSANPEKAMRLLKEAGYDGIKYKGDIAEIDAYGGRRITGKGDAFIAFDPTQIKSATGNSGAFDPANPDIRFMPDAGDTKKGALSGADEVTVKNKNEAAAKGPEIARRIMSAAPVSEQLNSTKAWLTPDGRWVNTGQMQHAEPHQNAFLDPELRPYALAMKKIQDKWIDFRDLAEKAGYLRVVKHGGKLYAGETANPNAKQTKQLKDTAIEQGLEYVDESKLPRQSKQIGLFMPDTPGDTTPLKPESIKEAAKLKGVAYDGPTEFGDVAFHAFSDTTSKPGARITFNIEGEVTPAKIAAGRARKLKEWGIEEPVNEEAKPDGRAAINAAIAKHAAGEITRAELAKVVADNSPHFMPNTEDKDVASFWIHRAGTVVGSKHYDDHAELAREVLNFRGGVEAEDKLPQGIYGSMTDAGFFRGVRQGNDIIVETNGRPIGFSQRKRLKEMAETTETRILIDDGKGRENPLFDFRPGKEGSFMPDAGKDASSFDTKRGALADIGEGKARFMPDASDREARAREIAKRHMKAPWEELSKEERQAFLNKAASEEPGESVGGFYSTLERVAAQKIKGRATAEQIAATLRNNGVKQEELDWVLGDYLRAKAGQKIEPSELAEVIAANKVELTEKTLGKEDEANLTPFQKLRYDELVAKGARSGVHNLTPDEIREWGAFRHIATAPTKFAQYQLPGGKNYRELLYALPTEKKLQKAVIEEKPNDKTYPFRVKLGNQTAMAVSREMAEALAQHMEHDTKNTANPADVFRSSHFDEPNIIFHLRVNDRKTADGRDMLFMEEDQSDLHQQGRKKGYKDTSFTKEMQAELDRLVGVDDETVDLTAAERARKRELIDLRNNTQAFAVPNLPFKNEAWKRLSLKKALALAVKEGKEAIGWTTGEQQAERYDLSKQVESVRVFKNEDGTFDVGAAKDGRIIPIRDWSVKAEELPDLIGKELAQKAIGQPSGLQVYTGVDLKVGGEGMKGFYDKELVNIANDLGKRYGARVAKEEVATAAKYKYALRRAEDQFGKQIKLPSGEPAYVLQDIETGDIIADYRQDTRTRLPKDGELFSKKEADEIADKKVADFQSQIWTLPITPELKAAIEKGQALFMPASKPAPSHQTKMPKNQGALAAFGANPADEVKRRKPVFAE